MLRSDQARVNGPGNANPASWTTSTSVPDSTRKGQSPIYRS